MIVQCDASALSSNGGCSLSYPEIQLLSLKSLKDKTLTASIKRRSTYLHDSSAKSIFLELSIEEADMLLALIHNSPMYQQSQPSGMESEKSSTKSTTGSTSVTSDGKTKSCEGSPSSGHWDESGLLIWVATDGET